MTHNGVQLEYDSRVIAFLRRITYLLKSTRHKDYLMFDNTIVSAMIFRNNIRLKKKLQSKIIIKEAKDNDIGCW